MVEVGGRPFLEYIVRHLVGQDFRRMLILLSYLGETIQDHFGDGKQYGARIQYAWEPSPLGTAGAIRNALVQLDEEFLLLYADSYLPIDYQEAAEAFRRAGCLGLLVAYDNRLADTGVQNNVATDAAGWVRRYQKGSPDSDLKYVEAGVLCFRRDVFAGLPPGQVISLEHEIYPRLIAQLQLRAFVTPQRFFDIGTRDRLEEFATTRT